MKFEELSIGTKFKKYNNGHFQGFFEKINPIEIPNLKLFGLVKTAKRLDGNFANTNCVICDKATVFNIDGEHIVLAEEDGKITLEEFLRIKKHEQTI